MKKKTVYSQEYLKKFHRKVFIVSYLLKKIAYYNFIK